MNPKYVTDLETSKQLKEAGCPQESEFWWVDLGREGWASWTLVDKDCASARRYNTGNKDIQFSAYLSDELLEMLPKECKLANLGMRLCQLHIIFEQETVTVGYWREQEPGATSTNGETLPNVLAQILLHLKQKGVIK